jgi:hypothetical protein
MIFKDGHLADVHSFLPVSEEEQKLLISGFGELSSE